MTDSLAAHPADVTRSRRWTALVFISIAQLMVIFDASIMNIALPQAQLDLAFSDADRQWVITAYSLAFGALLLLGGRVSDQWGRRRSFIVGLVGFSLASVLGGVAANIEMLLAARVLQGVFAALLTPAAMSLLSVTFPDGKERATAFGVFSAVAGAGGAIGLLLGGVLTEFASWRWTLLVNIVFGAVAVAGALVYVRDAGAERHRQRLDVPGIVLASVGLAALVFGLNRAETEGWGATATITSFVAAVVLLAVFVAVENRAAAPRPPMRVILDRNRGGERFTMPFRITRPGGAMLASVSLTAVLAGCSPAVTPTGPETNGPTPPQATTAESPIPMNDTISPPPMDDDEAAVLEANRERSRLLVEQRTDELDELLSPDFVAVHITGYEQTKAEWLDQIRSGQMRCHDFQEVSATVTIDADSAVAVTRSLVDATIYGSRGTWPLESTTTYVRDGGTWKAQRSRARTY